MVEKLDVKTSAFALAATSAILYILCLLIVSVFGASSVSTLSKIFHGIDLTKIASVSVSLTDAVIGLVELVVIALFTGAIFAKIYNLLLKK